MANLTYLSKGNPCLLIDGAEYFGAAAKRLHAYESTGYEPGEVHEMADRCAEMALEPGMRQLKVALDALIHEYRYELEHDAFGLLLRKIGTWMKAESEGRLLVLPCMGKDVTIERGGLSYKGDHWNPPELTAFAEDPTTRTGKRVALFNTREVAIALEERKADEAAPCQIKEGGSDYEM